MLQIPHYQDYVPPAGAVLVHLAEPALIPTATGQGATHVRAMVEQCRDLLAHPWRRIVYASSAAVYGDAIAIPRRCDERLTPSGPYAVAKLECEAAVLAAGGAVARFANLYGRGMHDATVIAEILAQLGRPGPLKVRNARAARDFLSVEDAAAGLQALSEDTAPRGARFNFGSGTGWRVADIARLALELAKEMGRDIVSTDPATPETSLLLDIAATTAALGWRPSVTLERWLAKAVNERLGR
jgi:UDP-glucose 4-epimerase